MIPMRLGFSLSSLYYRSTIIFLLSNLFVRSYFETPRSLRYHMMRMYAQVIVRAHSEGKRGLHTTKVQPQPVLFQ